MTANPILIKQARSLILRNLELVYPSGLNVKSLYQTACVVDQIYDFGLLRKDLAYLMEKGWLLLIGLGPGGRATLADVKEEALTVVKLTAAGLEIAQRLKTDEAIEL